MNSKGGIYHPIVSTLIQENGQIDHTETRFIMNGGVKLTKEVNYQTIRVWSLYQAMVKEMKENVQTALEAFNFNFEPIPVLYEHNYVLRNGAFF